MAKGTKTILTKAHSKNDSLRTTVPICIRNLFELEQGDEIRWEPDQKSDQLILKVNRMKKKIKVKE